MKSFEAKVEKTYQNVLKLVGLGEAPTKFNNYLLDSSKTTYRDGLPELPEDLENEVITIEDTFLEGPVDDLKAKLRKRG